MREGASSISEIGRKGIVFRSLRRASHIHKTLGAHAKMEPNGAKNKQKGRAFWVPGSREKGQRSVWGVPLPALLHPPSPEQANGEEKKNHGCEMEKGAAYYYSRWSELSLDVQNFNVGCLEDAVAFANAATKPHPVETGRSSGSKAEEQERREEFGKVLYASASARRSMPSEAKSGR